MHECPKSTDSNALDSLLQTLWMAREMTYSEGTHPEFKIICRKCDSEDVYIDNSLGFSIESGSWGSIDLVCNNCENRTEIVDS